MEGLMIFFQKAHTKPQVETLKKYFHLQTLYNSNPNPKPLTELTKKDNFSWGIEAVKAFEEMKRIMTSPPVLILPNFDLPFEVECDAAGRGIGVVLMQQRQPIAFFSKALSNGNLAKSVYEKELMALVLCIQH